MNVSEDESLVKVDKPVKAGRVLVMATDKSLNTFARCKVELLYSKIMIKTVAFAFYLVPF